jgi:signal transduction histidine kinase
MDSAWETYVQKAKDVDGLMKRSGESGASLAEYNEFLTAARAFMDLGQELARAHYESRSHVVEQATGTLTRLRLSVYGLLGMLFVFGAALALVVFKNLIAPLRVQLAQTEAHAERNEKLAALGLLAAGVAHEVRTPLTAIKAALFMQKKRLQPGTPERQEAQVIEGEILRLEGVVTDFLRFGRPAEPKLNVVPADLPLERARELLSPQLSGAGLELRHERQSEAPLSIRVDATQMQQVLINLIQNAAENMTNGGAITLRARGARRRLQNGETDAVILEVADNGSGILPEVEKRLFDPFFTTKANGTGLGLSIAARIVEMHGGALQYRTQPHTGTTFGIVLPEAKA